jgi:AcrR family transcriptional regulator
MGIREKKAKETREAFLDATIRMGAKYGLEKLTIKKIAEASPAVAATSYLYFKDKDDLMNQAFQKVDRSIATAFDHALAELSGRETLQQMAEKLWDMYFEKLMSDRDQTLYYFAFRSSPRYNKEIQQAQLEYFKSLVEFAGVMNQKYHVFDHVEWIVFWTFLIDGTLMFAYRILIQDIPDTPENRANMRRMCVSGVLGVAGK